MQTDQWYLKKLVEDIPEDEMHAALHDEDLQHDEQRGEEGDESEDDDDVSVFKGTKAKGGKRKPGQSKGGSKGKKTAKKKH